MLLVLLLLCSERFPSIMSTSPLMIPSAFVSEINFGKGNNRTERRLCNVVNIASKLFRGRIRADRFALIHLGVPREPVPSSFFPPQDDTPLQ